MKQKIWTDLEILNSLSKIFPLRKLHLRRYVSLVSSIKYLRKKMPILTKKNLFKKGRTSHCVLWNQHHLNNKTGKKLWVRNIETTISHEPEKTSLTIWADINFKIKWSLFQKYEAALKAIKVLHHINRLKKNLKSIWST